ncbi:MAG: phosphatidate cytidylyltransferase [Azoarcus sp.]|jgi:phosphatidate cytidylyltransferase|nr:phosphatidate cytidylyltransferase [Azoarcus sp.]
MLKTRIITATVLLAGLLVALFYFPMSIWLGFCAAICALLGWEWGGLAGWGEKARVAYGTALGCLCFILVPGLFQLYPGLLPKILQRTVFSLFLLAGVFWLFVVPFWLRYKWPLRNWIAALTGVIVLVPPILIFIVLRTPEDRWSLLMVCALVWVADIAAYFFGRAFGVKKLAPNISPGKTWAGAIGAVMGVLLYGNAILFAVTSDGTLRFGVQQVLLFQLAFIGLAVMSIVGDLFESLLKRQAGVKDSSNLLPGHGGILDRVDSLTSTLTLIGLVILSQSSYLFRHP